jgi:hypothetical protein
MLHTNSQQVLTLSQWERSLKPAQDDATSLPFLLIHQKRILILSNNMDAAKIHPAVI